MVEACVDDRVARRCRNAQAAQVLQVAAPDLRAEGDQPALTRVGSRETEHIVTAAISSGTIAPPMKPVAPVTKMRMLLFLARGYQATGPSSSEKVPVGPSSPISASSTARRAPCATVREPEKALRSVAV